MTGFQFLIQVSNFQFLIRVSNFSYGFLIYNTGLQVSGTDEFSRLQKLHNAPAANTHAQEKAAAMQSSCGGVAVGADKEEEEVSVPWGRPRCTVCVCVAAWKGGGGVME